MFARRLNKWLALLGVLLTLAVGHTALAHAGSPTPNARFETSVAQTTDDRPVSVIEFYDVKLRKKVAVEKQKHIRAG